MIHIFNKTYYLLYHSTIYVFTNNLSIEKINIGRLE